MKTFFPLVSILTLLLFSCKHEVSIDKSTADVIWKDIDSLTNYSKDYKICYIDSSWVTRTTNPVDTNFIKANLFKIDYDLSKNNFLNEQGFKYDFFFLDTLKNESSGTFILLLGKYLYTLDPYVLNQSHLFLLVISGNKVTTSYHLAETRMNPFFYDDNIKTSVILPGVKIISRTIWHSCSDFIIDNIQQCSWSMETAFNTYDPQVERFVPYKKTIGKTIHYKNKLN